MEFIILGLVLFIAGVSATMFYDKVKAENAKRAELYRSAPPKPARATVSKRGPISSASSSSVSSLDRLLSEAKTRQERGHRTVEVQTGNTTQTMSVEDLIKRIEQMKKKL